MNQDSKKQLVDPNFIKVIQLLIENEISYWICHGSLLGLVRDGELIHWDHDIDIGVWRDEYKEIDIINLFESAGFILQKDHLQKDHLKGSLNFTRHGGRSVDVNFFSDIKPKNENSVQLVGSLWCVPRFKITAILDHIIQKREYRGKHQILFNILNSMRSLLILIYKLLDKLNLMYIMKGYTIPKTLLLEFIEFKYFGLSCRIPKDSEAINSFIYGKNWRTPIKNFIWEKDGLSVITSDE